MNNTIPRLLPHKNRIVRCICCIMFQVALVTATCLSSQAYFCPVSERAAIKPIIILLPEPGLPTMESSVLVMPNNQMFNNRSGTDVCDRSLDPDRHVFVSYLPVVEIVTQKSHRYMPSEFSIDNLLYANLKLDRLVKEYEGLRERSQSLLNGLNVPFVNGSRNFNNLIEKTNDGLNRSINRVANQKISLAGPLVNSNRWIEQKDFSTAANGGRTASRQRLTLERRAISYSSGSASRDGVFSPKKATNDNKQTIVDLVEDNKNFQYGLQKDNQLPWLIRASRTIRNYLFENKIEALFLFIMLYIVLHLLFVSRK